MPKILFLLSLLIHNVHGSLDFTIETPINQEILSTLPNKKTIDLTIKYNIPPINEIKDICFQIDSITNQNTTVQETCTPATGQSITISNLPSSNYILSAITTGTIENTRGPVITTPFQVYNFDECIPNLEISNRSLIYIHNEQPQSQSTSNTTDVSIDFIITPTIVPVTNFKICSQLFSISEIGLEVRNLTGVTCFNTSETSLNINDLKDGYYQLQLYFQELYSNTYSNDITIITFEVASITKYIPIFQVLQTSYELIVNPMSARNPENAAEPEKTAVADDLIIPYDYRGMNEAIEQVNELIEICIEMVEKTNPTVPFISITCIKPTLPRVIRVQGLPAGVYEANLILRNREYPEIMYPKTFNTIAIEARAPVEFIPQYDWQPLRRWHSIPYGLETRLPISDSGTREARIPPVWKLQVPLPERCTVLSAYFLRAEVDKLTRLTQIRYIVIGVMFILYRYAYQYVLYIYQYVLCMHTGVYLYTPCIHTYAYAYQRVYICYPYTHIVMCI